MKYVLLFISRTWHAIKLQTKIHSPFSENQYWTTLKMILHNINCYCFNYLSSEHMRHDANIFFISFITIKSSRLWFYIESCKLRSNILQNAILRVFSCKFYALHGVKYFQHIMFRDVNRVVIWPMIALPPFLSDTRKRITNYTISRCCISIIPFYFSAEKNANIIYRGKRNM